MHKMTATPKASRELVRRLYFPLRSSVEFFAGPTSVAAGTRAKEGAVLFDEVWFESGMVIANVGEDASFTIYRPRHELGPEDLTDVGNAAKPGDNFVIAVGSEDSPGAPAAEMREVINTKAIERYAAEWHTSAIRELETLDVDWAKHGGLSDDELAKLAEPIREVGRHFKDQVATTGLPTFQATWAAEALAHDAVVARRIDAAMNLTSLFEPFVAPEASGLGSGADALGILVPNLEALTWENIAEYRQHPASSEARDKLREFERQALDQEPADAADFLAKVSTSITKDLMAALAETKINFGDALAAEAAKAGLSFIPFAGSLLGIGASALEIADQWASQRGRWYFALMKLHVSS
ncbi:MAG TPA: hypothetical protein VFX85_02025 [Solirubrobacterales bacterium]|nr:hypothetical protein [Solirubrobacterales bacterium]